MVLAKSEAKFEKYQTIYFNGWYFIFFRQWTHVYTSK